MDERTEVGLEVITEMLIQTRAGTNTEEQRTMCARLTAKVKQVSEEGEEVTRKTRGEIYTLYCKIVSGKLSSSNYYNMR